jgi:type I restriction enzyme S subunit
MDKRFLYYLLNTYAVRSQLKATATGATVKHTAPDRICEVAVTVPPLRIQRKIAAILSAYDDLIENNTRRVAILEEMAQMLYREWFVHFRFPGHEQVEMVQRDDERAKGSVSPVYGPIPEGWSVKRLEDVCHLTLGVSPKSKYYNEEGDGLPFHQGVSDFGHLYPVTRRYCSKIKRTAEPGDILFSVRAPVGRLNIADTKIVIGRGLHAIRSRTGNQNFIFLQLKEKFKEEDSIGSGTIFKSVTKADMLGIEFLVPPGSLIQGFEQVVDSMYKEIRNLTKRNRLLRNARDMLLPVLMSGQVDVSGFDVTG